MCGAHTSDFTDFLALNVCVENRAQNARIKLNVKRFVATDFIHFTRHFLPCLCMPGCCLVCHL